MPLRPLLPLFAAVAAAVLGLALGAQMQRENALPADWESQAADQKLATGNVIALTGLLVAGGVTAAVWTLAPAPRSAARDWRALGAIFLGAFVAINLLQTIYPFYYGLPVGEARHGNFDVNLLASNSPAAASALVPVFAAWVAGLYLLLWGTRAILRPGPRPDDGPALLRRQTGTLLVAAPLLGIAAFGCLRIMVALPPVPGATPYRVVLSLAALAFLGLLLAAAAKAWQLMRAVRDTRVAPLALEAWEGVGRAEVGLVGVLGLLGIAVLVMPGIAPDCAPFAADMAPCPPHEPALQYRDEIADTVGLLQTSTFGTNALHIHVELLLLALLPLVPFVAIHKRGKAYLDAARPSGGPNARPGAVPRGWTATLAVGLGLCLALGGLASFAPGPLWAWAGACLPIALAARHLAGPARRTQAILLAAFAVWCLGNSMQAVLQPSGILRSSGPEVSELWLWRLLGALLFAWAVATLVRAPAVAVRASTAIPMAAGAAVAALAVSLLELPLDIWTNSMTAAGRVHGASIFVGTALARQDLPAALTMHAVSLALCLGAAAVAARHLRPEWFRGRGRKPALDVRGAAQPMA